MKSGHPDVAFIDIQLVLTEILLENLQKRHKVLDQVGVFTLMSHIAKLEYCLFKLQVKS